MAWRLTGSIDDFLTAAGDHLRADAVLHTVPLTVLQTLRAAGAAAFGDDPPRFGWHESAGGVVDGAFFQTPPFPVLLASLPPGSAGCLLDALVAGGSPALTLNVAADDEASLLASWAAATGGSGTARMRSRLFRLGALAPPDALPPGAARIAGEGDRGLLVDWLATFAGETGAGEPENAARTVADRLSHRGFMLWETGGEPVAVAGLTRAVAGVVRVTDVFTPPAHRRRGYGGAVTTAVTRAALADGAAAVVLFTDLANPTSNALYQRLGYRPVGDRVVLDLSAADGAAPDVTGRAGASDRLRQRAQRR